MRSTQWQLVFLGTVSAFTARHGKTKKTNRCQDGRGKDLPDAY